jgi:hypothetical protein
MIHGGDWIPIVAILAGTVIIIVIVGISLIAAAIGKRGAGRRDLQELRQDISQIKSNIEEMREQLADIIIRLG